MGYVTTIMNGENLGGAVKAAPPPLHSTALVLFVLTLCLLSFPSPSSSFDAKLFDAFTSSSYEFVTINVLAAVRLTFAVLGLGTTLAVVCFRT